MAVASAVTPPPPAPVTLHCSGVTVVVPPGPSQTTVVNTLIGYHICHL